MLLRLQQLLLVCLLCTGVLTAGSASARTVVDHAGRTVEIPDAVSRYAVTNIYPFASASVVFLGGPDKLVGMHPLSMKAAREGLLARVWPEVSEVDTTFMQGTDLNIESLMALAPDVVFVNSGDAAQIRQLEAAGIPALAVSVSKWDYNVMQTYEAWLDLLSEVFPNRSARAAREAGRKLLETVRERTAAIKPEERRRVLFLVQYDANRIVTSGRRFFGQYWAQAAGASNVAEAIEAKTANALVNFEQILDWNPDAVMITNFTTAAPEDILENRLHDWSSVAAVNKGAVYKMPLGLYRSFTPAADSPLTLLWMAKTLYPQRFADLDLIDATVAFYRDAFGMTISSDDARRLTEVAGK